MQEKHSLSKNSDDKDNFNRERENTKSSANCKIQNSKHISNKQEKNKNLEKNNLNEWICERENFNTVNSMYSRYLYTQFPFPF